MNLGTELQTNERRVLYEIWNGETAVSHINGKDVVFSDQNARNRSNPHRFEESDLEKLKEVAKMYNAQIVQVTTTTVKVQERKVMI